MQCLSQPFSDVCDGTGTTPGFLVPGMTDDPFTRALASERRYVAHVLEQNVPLHKGIADKLGKVLSSAVSSPGGLFRFDVSHRMVQAFGGSRENADSLACAVEFFHIASLMLDDLPQMDNSLERRGCICPHLLYGEDMVILGSLGLITRAYALLGLVISSVPSERHRSAHQLVEQCLGTAGMLNGQARDLSYATSGGGRREAIAVASGKTVPLIHLALALPALLFGADRRTLTSLRRLSLLWGLFYQGVDDFKDLLEKSATSGKTAGRDQELGRPNIALAIGERDAEAYLHRLNHLAGRCVAGLLKQHPSLLFLNAFQQLLSARWQKLAH